MRAASGVAYRAASLSSAMCMGARRGGWTERRGNASAVPMGQGRARPRSPPWFLTLAGVWGSADGPRIAERWLALVGLPRPTYV